jgi:hypothetical protein
MIRKSVQRFSEKIMRKQESRDPAGGAAAMAKKVVVAGATGLVGNAALRHFGASGGAEMIALSRRKPRDLYGARHVALDLTVSAQCAAIAAELKGTTHLIYAAL